LVRAAGVEALDNPVALDDRVVHRCVEIGEGGVEDPHPGLDSVRPGRHAWRRAVRDKVRRHKIVDEREVATCVPELRPAIGDGFGVVHDLYSLLMYVVAVVAA
jgi:hypothetical protein